MATTDIFHISAPVVPARRAVRFLGGDVDDGIQVDAFVATRTAADDASGTITAWINVPDITGTYTILGMGDANAVEYIHFSVEAGKLWLMCVDATVTQFDTNTTNVVIEPHKWVHVAVVQKTGTGGPKFFVNGLLVPRTDTDTTDMDEWIVNLDGLDGGHIGAADSVGGLGALTQEFKGAIGKVNYYNVALTEAQVLADYEGKTNVTGTVADLTNSWDMDDDYVDGVAGEDGTAVGAIVLIPNYSEFSSRIGFQNSLTAPVVADVVALSADDKMGHAIIIKAA